MRRVTTLTFAAALAFSTSAFAQGELITVDLSDISADLATELDVDVDDVPTSIELSADLAAEVCDVDVATITDSCVAVMSTADLIAAIEDGENNSAREFAPGHQDGPAVEFAPGQQDGPAKDFAPGQVKEDKAGDANGGDGEEDSGNE